MRRRKITYVRGNDNMSSICGAFCHRILSALFFFVVAVRCVNWCHRGQDVFDWLACKAATRYTLLHSAHITHHVTMTLNVAVFFYHLCKSHRSPISSEMELTINKSEPMSLFTPKKVCHNFIVVSKKIIVCRTNAITSCIISFRLSSWLTHTIICIYLFEQPNKRVFALVLCVPGPVKP